MLSRISGFSLRILAGFSSPREASCGVRSVLLNGKSGMKITICVTFHPVFYVPGGIRTHDLPLRRQLPGSPSESIVDYLIQILYTRAFTLLIHLNIAEYLSGPSESISFS